MHLMDTTPRRLTCHLLVTVLLPVLLVVAEMVMAPSVAAQGGDQVGLAGTIVLQTVSGGPIYAVNANGDHLRYLTTGMDPALSPGAEWVAFTRWDNPQHGATGSLWVINVDGSGERLVLDEIHQPKAPTWSPNGTQIILSMQFNGVDERMLSWGK